MDKVKTVENLAIMQPICSDKRIQILEVAPGIELKVTLELTQRMVSGKMCPVSILRIVGLATYQAKDREILADAATFIDYGPKQGVTSNYTLHKDQAPTEEERAAGRRNILETAVRALEAQGIW